MRLTSACTDKAAITDKGDKPRGYATAYNIDFLFRFACKSEILHRSQSERSKRRQQRNGLGNVSIHK
jgi:hypothetical protein